MGIPHSHVQRRVPKNLLQRQNIPAIHHEVRREGVAQNVGALATRQLDIAAPHHTGECLPAERESSLLSEVGFKTILQPQGDQHRPYSLRLGVGEHHTTSTNHSLSFRLSSSGGQADFGNQRQVREYRVVP